jgi:signal transduction histidine kinase
MTSPTSAAARRLYRQRDGRLVAGVATGLSEHLGIDVVLFRIGFVVSVVLGGLGVLLYAGFWAAVPQAVQREGSGSTPRPRSSRRQLAGFAVLSLIALLAAQLIGFDGDLLWPAAAALTGAAILWRQTDEAQRRRWRELTTRGADFATGGSRASTLLRYALGLLLLVIGLAAIIALRVPFGELRRAVIPVVVVVAGLFLVVGPWMLQTVRQLADERTARIRELERIELAGRVHDSMLQTLTLIQQRVDSPDEVLRLVRRSERELRGWLYSPGPSAASLQTAIRTVAADVEDEYAVSVELVAVGDCPVTDAVEPLVMAVREAIVNAAKHSGVRDIAVYLEVDATTATVFVRDRGRGFDPAAVPADRHGLADSIVARMRRHGGDAVVRSAPATGTEVRLTLPVDKLVSG